MNLSLNADDLIAIINEKLVAVGSDIRVDDGFSIARLRMLAPLTAQQIKASIFHPPPEKVICHGAFRAITTTEFADAMGYVLTTPRQLWGNCEMQIILSAYSGVQSFIERAPDDVNFTYVKYCAFQQELGNMLDENRDFRQLMIRYE